MTGSRARKAEAITVEAKTKWAAPSLVQKRRQKRSELMLWELEAIALAMFEERGFATVNVEEIGRTDRPGRGCERAAGSGG